MPDLVSYPVEEHAISEFWRDMRQGVRVQDWPWPIQASTTQPHARQSSPEGSHPKEPIQRCTSCQGHAIGCGTRLALLPWDGSDGMLFYGIGY